ncbi:grass induced protein [Epichloe bromicola]|uniref:Grass induced protein n=1 Tax=Epichloe bromicola TaxID=79588 RepID=A0ABQ0CSW5_9HYPO
MQFTWFYITTLLAFGLAAPSDKVDRDVVQDGDELVKRPNFKIVYRGADIQYQVATCSLFTAHDLGPMRFPLRFPLRKRGHSIRKVQGWKLDRDK